MFELARCPACGRFAAGLAEWSSGQLVRCPHCLAEFLLRNTTVQPLPQLIPIAELADESTGDQLSGAPPPRDPPTGELPALEPDEPALAESAAVPSADEIPAGHDDAQRDRVAAPDIQTETSGAETDKTPEEVDTYALRSPAGSSGARRGLPPVYADAYDFIPEDRKKQIETAAAVAARLRGSTRRRSGLGELLKVVLGGLVGLAIGYWVLNYFWGPRFDRLEVYLPGCPHTYNHWPAGALPSKSAEPTESTEPTAPAQPADVTAPTESAERTEPTAHAASSDSFLVPTLPGLGKPQQSDSEDTDRKQEKPAGSTAPEVKSESTVAPIELPTIDSRQPDGR